MSPGFCLFQGHGRAGAVPDHHNRLLQGSHGRSKRVGINPAGWVRSHVEHSQLTFSQCGGQLDTHSCAPAPGGAGAVLG